MAAAAAATALSRVRVERSRGASRRVVGSPRVTDDEHHELLGRMLQAGIGNPPLELARRARWRARAQAVVAEAQRALGLDATDLAAFLEAFERAGVELGFAMACHAGGLPVPEDLQAAIRVPWCAWHDLPRLEP